MLEWSNVAGLFASVNPWVLGVGIIIFILLLTLLICLCIHWFNRSPNPKNLPTMPKRDFTLQELSQFDGTGPDGRILIAVNGNVFDVTHDGKGFYGRDGPYAIFAGRDASRSLTMFTTDMPSLNEEYDDLSDLTPDQVSNLREWELQTEVSRLNYPANAMHVISSRFLSCLA